MNVLLIEPDKLLAKNVSRALKSAGYSVDWRQEPQAAITAADATSPDLIIMDLILSFHSGLEFLYELRSYPEWALIPAIVFSSLTSEELNFRATGYEQLGINKFLPKNSTSLSELVAAVNELSPVAKA